MSDYFYGWYFRCQGKEGSFAVIPAVHLSSGKNSCSVQVITGSGSLYREFPIAKFRIDRKKGIMRIGDNLFSRRGICFDFEAILSEGAGHVVHMGDGRKPASSKARVRGCLHFGGFSEPKYDIMGPFALIPGMECRHTVYSMRHTVDGELRINDEKVRFQNGLGYMEGDSGTSFPERYIWTQHFLPEGSIMVAAASIPLAGARFTGAIGLLFREGREYRFATYLGASVERLGDGELLIRQGRYRLHVRFLEPGGNVLKAPDSGRMTRRIRENIACRAEYRLTCGNKVLLHASTDRAAAEYDEKEEDKC